MNTSFSNLYPINQLEARKCLARVKFTKLVFPGQVLRCVCFWTRKMVLLIMSAIKFLNFAGQQSSLVFSSIFVAKNLDFVVCWKKTLQRCHNCVMGLFWHNCHMEDSKELGTFGYTRVYCSLVQARPWNLYWCPNWNSVRQNYREVGEVVFRQLVWHQVSMLRTSIGNGLIWNDFMTLYCFCRYDCLQHLQFMELIRNTRLYRCTFP